MAAGTVGRGVSGAGEKEREMGEGRKEREREKTDGRHEKSERTKGRSNAVSGQVVNQLDSSVEWIRAGMRGGMVARGCVRVRRCVVVVRGGGECGVDVWYLLAWLVKVLVSVDCARDVY